MGGQAGVHDRGKDGERDNAGERGGAIERTGQELLFNVILGEVLLEKRLLPETQRAAEALPSLLLGEGRSAGRPQVFAANA